MSTPRNGGEIRCPSCARLLAKRGEEDGLAVAFVASGPDGRAVTVRDGELHCLRCSVSVTIRPMDRFFVVVGLPAKGSTRSA